VSEAHGMPTERGSSSLSRLSSRLTTRHRLGRLADDVTRRAHLTKIEAWKFCQMSVRSASLPRNHHFASIFALPKTPRITSYHV
jgi:hypothetical protein